MEMNNNFYNIQQLKTFNPDRQKGINFYTWSYSPNLTIDLSLSFYHRIIVTDNILATYIKPKPGYFYVFQYEIYYGKSISHRGALNYRNFFNPLYNGVEPFGVVYLIAQCKLNYERLEVLWLTGLLSPL